jgi:hypothetical protein
MSEEGGGDGGEEVEGVGVRVGEGREERTKWKTREKEEVK